jgi:flagellar biosynthetic protein FliR
LNFGGIGPAHLLGGILIFIRVMGIFAAAPIFGHVHLPLQVKLSFALLIAVVLLPVVHLPDPAIADNIFMLGGAAVKEAAVGLILGFTAMLIFVAIQLAGEAADIQIGFGMASIVDPLLGTQTALVGQFQFMVATLFFLVINGHHYILMALAKSFELVPLNGFVYHTLLTGRVLQIVSDLFLIGLRLGAPVMLAVFLTDLALGLLGRTVPQMNLLLVGFPVKIAVGLTMLIASVPFFMVGCRSLFGDMYRDLMAIVRAMT